MRFCEEYYKNYKYLDQINEIKINFKDADIQSLTGIINLCKEKRKRLIIKFDAAVSNDIFDAIINMIDSFPKDYSLCIDIKNKDIIKLLQDNNINFFFYSFVNNWEELNYCIKQGVSDIYITEILGFDIVRAAEVCHDSDVLVRVFPNVCQASYGATTEEESLRTFFIRPEDLKHYEDFIDVVEFFGDKTRREISYKAYAIDKKWPGQLGEIIIGLKSNIDNRRIDNTFAIRRRNCRKKCIKGAGCRHCSKILELANILKEKDLIFEKKKSAISSLEK